MEWKDVFAQCGWVAPADVLCRFMLQNEFGTWSELELADDPATWLGADQLGAEELECIRKVMRIGKRMPRSPKRAKVQMQQPCESLLGKLGEAPGLVLNVAGVGPSKAVGSMFSFYCCVFGFALPSGM